MAFTALYDACILYPAPLRDLLIRLARTGMFRAKWSSAIHDEWTRNVLANRSDITPAQLDRTRRLMDGAVLDALVTDFEPLIPTLTLPDPGDRHVLAAAIQGRADVIVTYNLKDFPAATLAPYGIETQHPDTFITDLIDLDVGKVCEAVRQQRASLRNPPVQAGNLLTTFAQQGLVQTSAQLSGFVALL